MTKRNHLSWRSDRASSLAVLASPFVAVFATDALRLHQLQCQPPLRFKSTPDPVLSSPPRPRHHSVTGTRWKTLSTPGATIYATRGHFRPALSGTSIVRSRYHSARFPEVRTGSMPTPFRQPSKALMRSDRTSSSLSDRPHQYNPCPSWQRFVAKSSRGLLRSRPGSAPKHRHAGLPRALKSFGRCGSNRPKSKR